MGLINFGLEAKAILLTEDVVRYAGYPTDYKFSFTEGDKKRIKKAAEVCGWTRYYREEEIQRESLREIMLKRQSWEIYLSLLRELTRPPLNRDAFKLYMPILWEKIEIEDRKNK